MGWNRCSPQEREPPSSRLCEIHPAALTDGTATVIITCRARRSNQQYTAKRLAELRARQHRKKQYSRSWRRLQRRENRWSFEAETACPRPGTQSQSRRRHLGKGTRSGYGGLGDVRDVADGKRLRATSQQKNGAWSHGRKPAYITYKAAAAGIAVTLVEEAYTGQACLGILPDGTSCLQCYKREGARLPVPGLWFRLGIGTV